MDKSEKINKKQISFIQYHIHRKSILDDEPDKNIIYENIIKKALIQQNITTDKIPKLEDLSTYEAAIIIKHIAGQPIDSLTLDEKVGFYAVGIVTILIILIIYTLL